MKTVAVFFGGRSNEREISVITGVYAVNLLRESYRVLPVYLPPEGGFVLGEGLRGVEDFRASDFVPVVLTDGGLALERRPKKKFRIDCALNCCHGGSGEGGVLSALFEWYNIPSASPAMTPSALFLDKSLSKLVLKGLGVPALPSFTVREGAFATEDWKRSAEELGYPLIVKPCKLGSSIGITVAKDEGELRRALAFAFRLDGAALVEKYLGGKRDLNLAVYRRGKELVFSPVEEVISASPILTFGEKYEGGEHVSKLPAAIPAQTEARMKEALACVYEQFDMQGVVRADFLLGADGALYFNELNTVPGTLASYLFGERLTDAKKLLSELVEEGMRQPRPHKLTLQSGILSSPVFGAKGAKRTQTPSFRHI